MIEPIYIGLEISPICIIFTKFQWTGGSLLVMKRSFQFSMISSIIFLHDQTRFQTP